MNNKGFAITTLIYGLAIMMLLLIAIIMATLTSMRKNMKDLSDQIEEELLTLSNGTVEYTDYSPNYIDYYTVPHKEEQVFIGLRYGLLPMILDNMDIMHLE